MASPTLGALKIFLGAGAFYFIVMRNLETGVEWYNDRCVCAAVRVRVCVRSACVCVCVGWRSLCLSSVAATWLRRLAARGAHTPQSRRA
jgi:hypothetical protein